MRLIDHLAHKESVRVYTNYLRNLELLLRPLTPNDREEVIREIESHIYEMMSREDQSLNEVSRLLNAMDAMGEVSQMVDPIVADKTIEYASHSLNPTRLLTAFANNSGYKLRQLVLLSFYSLFHVLALLVLSLSLVKSFNPAVGVHVGEGGIFVLGTVDEASRAREVLGYWIIPISILIATGCYWLALQLLKMVGKK